MVEGPIIEPHHHDALEVGLPAASPLVKGRDPLETTSESTAELIVTTSSALAKGSAPAGITEGYPTSH